MFALILKNITIYVCIFQVPPSYPEFMSMKPPQKARQKAHRQGKGGKVQGSLGHTGTYSGTLRSHFPTSTVSRPHYPVSVRPVGTSSGTDDTVTNTSLFYTDVPLAPGTVSLDPDVHMIMDTGTVSHEIEVTMDTPLGSPKTPSAKMTTPDNSTLGDSTLEELLKLGKTPDNSGTQDLSATSQTSQTTADMIDQGLDLESDLQSKNIEK
jgi:hypothetical protein